MKTSGLTSIIASAALVLCFGAPVRAQLGGSKILDVDFRKVVSRAEIQARIWDDSFDLSTNIIDVYINALRKKIDGGDREKLIQTVRGVGYRVREPGAGPDV